MCLAIPGLVKSIDGDKAKVNFLGVIREVNISLISFKLKINDYVLVHAGFVIEKLQAKEAKASLKIYEEISRSIE